MPVVTLQRPASGRGQRLGRVAVRETTAPCLMQRVVKSQQFVEMCVVPIVNEFPRQTRQDGDAR